MTPTTQFTSSLDRSARRLHPLPVRLMHWSNAIAILIMIGSGWHIYEDEPIFGVIRFPSAITLAPDPEGALLWHFAAMWLLVLNGLAYLIYGSVTGRFRRMFFPIGAREVLTTAKAALHFRLGHEDVTTYNAVQKLLYIGVIFVITVQILSGLAIWKPVQFQELVVLFQDFQGARLVHFFGMAATVLFLVIHVLLAVLVPRTLVAMVTGGPRIGADRIPPAPRSHLTQSVE